MRDTTNEAKEAKRVEDKKEFVATALLATYHRDGQQETSPETFHNTRRTRPPHGLREPRRIFLDRLATVFASGLRKRHHVTASILVETSGTSKIIIAQNRGCGLEDEKLAQLLQSWLQKVAGRTATSENKYEVWSTLLKHNKDLLHIHVEHSLIGTTLQQDSFAPSNREFLESCPPKFKHPNDKHVLIAHELRKAIRDTTNANMTQQRINLMGSYRAALLTFEDYTSKNPNFTRLIICCPDSPKHPTYAGPEI